MNISRAELDEATAFLDKTENILRKESHLLSTIISQAHYNILKIINEYEPKEEWNNEGVIDGEYEIKEDMGVCVIRPMLHYCNNLDGTT